MRTLYKQRHSSKYETIKNFNEQSYRDFVDLGTLTILIFNSIVFRKRNSRLFGSGLYC